MTEYHYRPITVTVAVVVMCHAGSERIPQAASNTLSGLDDKTTKSLLSVSNIKTVAPRRHRPDISLSENYGNFYLDYLHCDETLPPTSVYEYSSYPYEHEPFSKSYQFMAEDSAGRSPSPPPVEYFTIVNSVAPDLERIRYKSKHEVRVERANTPASSVKTKDSSLPAANVNREESGETTPTKNAVSESGNEGEDETFKSEKQLSRMRLMKSLVPSPLFQFTAYPTPRGGVLREKSPGRSRTVTSANNSNTSGLEKAVTAISFEPPFHIGNFNKPREATKSAGKLRTSTDKTNPNAIIQPMRTAPSIPSVHSAFGSRSPRLTRNHPFSGEHDRSAHRQLNPLEYLKKVQGMRAEDVYIEDGKREDTGKLSSYLDVRPMSSHLDLRHTQADLSVHNAIKFDRERIQTPVEQLCTSPAFITESNEDGSYHPPEQRCNSARPKSSLSSASNPRSSRPIPQYMKTEHWEKVDADTQRQKEAAAAVSIQKIFRGYVSRKVYLNLRRDYRAEQENKRISAIRIQRSWRQHRNRLKQIYSQPTVSPVTLQRVKDFKSLQLQQEAQRESKRMAEIEQMKRQEQESKETISVIGPHVEIYSAYHPLKYGASKKEVEKAIVVIQKNVRGMQCRQYLNVLKEKAKDHASTWAEWVSYYKKFLKRILHRRGIDKPDIVINLEQMKKFMSQKKRYESVFDRRAFGGELEEDEIVQFFRECDLMPANHEIEHAIDLVFKGKPRSKKTTFKKREVLDVVFEIYKPEGTGIINDRKSTWLHPIVDGEDAMKMLGSDMVEPTPLGPCIQLVADSMRERKEKAAEEERLRIIANQKELRKCQAESAANSSQPTILDNSQPSEPATLQIFSSEPMTSAK
ncbi:IQCM [Bugula neritina]|uniref:IQCM n=1 Tax=Bugula neritina TaxID=10212 RepID=A0A7J7JTP1_BUGNE|nr:IQCM [Bugula neritina]